MTPLLPYPPPPTCHHYQEPVPGILAPSYLPVFSPTATTAPLGWKSAQRPVSWEGREGDFKKMPF